MCDGVVLAESIIIDIYWRGVMMILLMILSSIGY